MSWDKNEYYLKFLKGKKCRTNGSHTPRIYNKISEKETGIGKKAF